MLVDSQTLKSKKKKKKNLRLDHLLDIYVEWMMIHTLVLITIWGHYHLELRKIGLFIIIIIIISDLRSFIDH
jgi:hypothetical protein